MRYEVFRPPSLGHLDAGMGQAPRLCFAQRPGACHRPGPPSADILLLPVEGQMSGPGAQDLVCAAVSWNP